MTEITSDIQQKNSEDQLSFIYGDKRVGYTLIREPVSKLDKIQIKVHPNTQVLVKAPESASNEQIHQAILKRARWIWKSLQEYSVHQSLKTTKHYRSGEMMFYMGRRYVLKLIQSQNNPTVKLIRGQLQVFIPTTENVTTERIQFLTQQRYRQQAQRVFNERLKILLSKTNWVKDLPPLKILYMEKQWGSCSIRGTIILNPNLIKAPKECIDYVILHELCHIAEHNHSERFWRLLTQVMPNWKQIKSKLDGMAEMYL